MYKTIIGFFSCFSYKNILMGRVKRVGNGWNVHTHKGDGAIFWEIYQPFFLTSLGRNYFLVYMISN